MRLLISIDDSAHSRSVIGEARRRPWPEGTDIKIVTVVPGSDLSAARGEALAKARLLLDDALESLKESGLQASTEVLEGHVRQALLETVARMRPDLVMVGSQGKTALQRAFLGSVSSAIVAHAPCSVEVVKPPVNGGERVIRNVLLAMDNSAFSQRALEFAASLNWLRDTHWRVVVAVGRPSEAVLREASGAGVHRALDEYQQTLRPLREFAARTAEQLKARFGADAVNHLLEEGDAREVILSEAKRWPADLIIVGSHGRSGFTRVWLGSVSEAVVQQAPCSVLVAKLPAGAGTTAG